MYLQEDKNYMDQNKLNNLNNQLNIGNKISEYRKEKGSTQEQLADYVGVSVAAVSKWETNQSYPDITLLTSIAEFFGVSIDSLLGYNTTDGYKQNLEKIYDLLSDSEINNNYNKGLPIVLNALKKYPNDIHLLQSAAGFLSNRSWSHNDDEKKKKDALDAINYLEKALKCPDISKKDTLWFKKEISLIYWNNLNDYKKALDILNDINESQKFSSDIAWLKYHMGEKKECKQILQSVLLNTFFEFWSIAGRLANCYEDEGNLEMALEAQKLHANYVAAFTWDIPNYADDLCAWSYLAVARYCKKLDKIDEMWENIGKSVYHAVRFEENPSYKSASVKFCDEMKGGGFGTSSSNIICPGILRELQNDFKEFEADERYIKFCEELNAAKKTKIEAGVWEE